MNGEIPLDQVYASSWKMIRPNHAAINTSLATLPRNHRRRREETIAALKRGWVIHLVTAGIEQALERWRRSSE